VLVIILGFALLVLACSRSGAQPEGKALGGSGSPTSDDSSAHRISTTPSPVPPKQDDPMKAGPQTISGKGPYADSRGLSQSRASGLLPDDP
jgi:hypothetical protein